MRRLWRWLWAAFLDSPELAYERGRQVVIDALAGATSRTEMDRRAADLMALSSGGFNVTDCDAAFDRGVRYALGRMGYYEEARRHEEG